MQILITGGTGIIGQALHKTLVDAGHKVFILSRKKNPTGFIWGPEKNYIDPQALEKTDVVIHLAGENVGSKRWTPARKQALITSRVSGTKCLVDALEKQNHRVQLVLFASAIGYYGTDQQEIVYTESDKAGSDFLAYVTQTWEAEMHKLKRVPYYIVRIGVVLAAQGGALEKILLPIRIGLGSKIGTGNQYLSWIHIHDLVQIFLFLLEKKPQDKIFNAVAPSPLTQWEFTKIVAQILKKPLFLPPVPTWVLRIILGEMHVLVTQGTKVSSEKIMQAGYRFQFSDFKTALENILQRTNTNT